MKEQNLEAVYINCWRINIILSQYVFLTGDTALVRVVAIVGQWWSAPHLKSVPHITRLCPWLLHTSNTVFLKCAPILFLINPAAESWRRAWPLSLENWGLLSVRLLEGKSNSLDIDKYTVVRRAFSERIHFHHRNVLCSYLSIRAKYEKLTEGISTTCSWNLRLDQLIQKLTHETELHPAMK